MCIIIVTFKKKGRITFKATYQCWTLYPTAFLFMSRILLSISLTQQFWQCWYDIEFTFSLSFLFPLNVNKVYIVNIAMSTILWDIDFIIIYFWRYYRHTLRRVIVHVMKNHNLAVALKACWYVYTYLCTILKERKL